ncbi:MAG: hypothetical protein E6303_06520, partial [Clostridium perfringens]|nr:hypothetical protein [Clostridium perfringens]
ISILSKSKYTILVQYSLSNSSFLFNRPGFDKNDLLKRKEEFDREYCTNIVYLDLLNIEISSTLIRERVHASLEVKFFLPPGVVDIIDKYNLYRRE